MRPPRALLLVLAIAVAAAQPPAPAPAPAPPTAAKRRTFSADFLFTQTARRATLERASPSNATHGTLTLVDPAPHTIWFTDRPARAAGAFDNAYFLSPAFTPNASANATWLGGPNAVLVSGGARAVAGQKKHPADDDVAIVLSLASPRIAKNGDVAYDVTVVKPGTDTGGVAANYLAAGEGEAPSSALLAELPTAKRTLDAAYLFIDDYYMEMPAAGAAPATSPPPPPPPASPPPPPPFNNAGWDARYQDKLWDRISGPQPVSAYSCQFTGGCGYGGYGGGGFGVPSWG